MSFLIVKSSRCIFPGFINDLVVEFGNHQVSQVPRSGVKLSDKKGSVTFLNEKLNYRQQISTQAHSD